MEEMSNLIPMFSTILVILGCILGIFWLILPFILIKKMSNIEDAIRMFHTDLAQFLNEYTSKTQKK